MVLAIVPFQSLLRGVITRKYVARWHYARTKVVSDWQARVRRHFSNKLIRPRLSKELAACIVIQRIVRGKLGRVKAYKIYVHICAERIQTMWRGVIARVKTDKIWLNRQVVPIQCLIRKRIAKRFTLQTKSELGDAAVKIQKCFRCWKSCRRQAEFLNAREFEYREDTVTALMAEEEFVYEKLSRLAQRVAKVNSF
jgi:IQ calmodulin-binding motif